MSGVVAIGETHELQGFALAGAVVIVAATETEFADAWRELPAGTGLVILSAMAAGALRSSLAERPDVLTAVMP
jgi:vacuolar-type H+-ATPase subunit F/Vma7